MPMSRMASLLDRLPMVTLTAPDHRTTRDVRPLRAPADPATSRDLPRRRIDPAGWKRHVCSPGAARRWSGPGADRDGDSRRTGFHARACGMTSVLVMNGPNLAINGLYQASRNG